MADLPPQIRDAVESVACALAGYWEPVRAPADGSAVYYDEVDYGQAAHVLTVLLDRGWVPPGGPIEMPEELANLVVNIAELPKEGLDPNDPMLSTPIILHLQQIRRLQTISRYHTEYRYFGTLVRSWVLDKLDEVEQSPCLLCGSCCTTVECATGRCEERGCECTQRPVEAVAEVADVAAGSVA